MDNLKETVQFYPVGTKVTFTFGRDKVIQTGVIWGVRITSSVRYVWGKGDGSLEDVEYATIYQIRATEPESTENGQVYRMWDYVTESDITPILL